MELLLLRLRLVGIPAEGLVEGVPDRGCAVDGACCPLRLGVGLAEEASVAPGPALGL